MVVLLTCCRRAFFVLFICLFCITGRGQAAEPIKVYVDNNYPPYMYSVSGTQADGLYPRLLQAIIDRTEYQFEILAFPWKRALLHGAAGRGVVGGAYMNNERLKVYDYSDPLYQEELVLFVQKQKAFDFKSVEDLAGKTIGVNRGWSYGQVFDDARERKVFQTSIRNTPAENFKLLSLGRIDAVILDRQSGESYLKLSQIENQITVLPKAFSINDGYLIVSKELAMSEFLKAFNKALKQIQDDGTYQLIVENFVQRELAD